MACIAGTVDNPHVWYRYSPPATDPSWGTRMYGRICTRKTDRTNRFKCGSCPAYRGAVWNGATATGITPRGEFYALSGDEHRVLAALQQKADEDFEELPETFWKFLDYMAAGKKGAIYGMDSRRRLGDEEAAADHAAKKRAARAADGGHYRDYMRGYMRDYRARKRAAAALVCVRTPPSDGESQ